MKSIFTSTGAVFTVFFLSLLFWAFQFYHRLPAVTDVFLYTYPSQSVNLVEFQKGFLPFWDASTGCGTPQLANSLSACFYPPFRLWNWTGLSHWIIWISLLHVAFAFVGFYLWARTQGAFPLWAALGALSFAGSLHMVRCWGYPVFSASQAWTPWIFLAAARFLAEGSVRWWAALVGVVGLQVLAGYPFFSFYTLFFLAAWTFFQKSDRQRKTRLALAVSAAFGLTAIHWLPFLDLLHYSTRGTWGTPDQFPYFSKVIEYLSLLSPTVLGKAEAGSYLGQTANATFMMYFGLIPLAAWVFGGLFQNHPGCRFWGLSALAWMVWLSGFHFPLWRILPESSLEALNPSKAVGVFIFAACTCAILALTRFFRDGWDEGKRRIVIGILDFFWLVDILSVPFRVVHPIPDPFLKPEMKVWTERVRAVTEGGRLLSLHRKDQVDLTGSTTDTQSLEAAADQWVGNLLTNSNAVWGIRTPQAYLSLWTDSMDQLWKTFNKIETYDTPLPDLAGVRAGYFPVTLSSPHYQVLEVNKGSYLMRNAFCKEDAWPAEEAVSVQNQQEAMATLLQEKGNPAEGNSVLLESGTNLSAARRPLMEGGTSASQRLCGSRFHYQGVFSAPGWLFWNETFTPGWRAWVDGFPTLIQRADGFFMAVPVGKEGEHQVDFRYEPVAFRLGLFLSLACFILGVGGLGLRWKFCRIKMIEEFKEEPFPSAAGR